MKKLELNQGRACRGQVGCPASVAGLVLTYAGSFAITAVTGGAELFAAAFIVG